MHLSRECKKQALRDWHERFGKGRVACAVEHMIELDSEFPEVEIFGPQCVSAHVGPGWKEVIRPVLFLLREAGGRVTQIKQKFGGLRIYWEPSDDRGPLAKMLNIRVEEAVHEAEDISLLTCEECAASLGSAVGSGRQTLCQKCALK